MSSSQSSVEIFFSYAHEDEPLRQKLEKHLSLLHQQGLIQGWHDRHILPGNDWAQAIDTHLEHASVILLLISADFLASDYCYGIEMKRALERHEANEARVIPILLRPVDWKGAPFERLQVLPTDAKPILTWHSQDEAFADVAAGIRRAIEDLSLLQASVPRVALPPVWNIPYPRNAFFIGREDILSRLRIQLQAGQAAALSQPQAISGLGGIGKTQIAVEYAYRYHQDYQIVLWARAESREALISSYVAIADLLTLPEKDAQDQTITVHAVKAWLQTHRQWLLILDNADELAIVPEFLPPALGGHLLLTTRASALGRLANCIEIQTLEPEQGALLVLRRASLLAADCSLEQVSSSDRVLALQITQELEGLPLALDQAGAYLEETGSSLSEYLQVYQRRRRDLLKKRGGLVADHPESVATTWSLSFERIAAVNPVAANLLQFCVFLSSYAIPEELVLKGFTVLSEKHLFHELERDFKSSFSNESSLSVIAVSLTPKGYYTYEFNEALSLLKQYSLVRRNADSKVLSIHRLVQAVLIDEMGETEKREWVGTVVRAVDAVFPDVRNVELWHRCEVWLPHVLRCAEWIRQYDLRLAKAAHLLCKVGYYLYERGQYPEAQCLSEQALLIAEDVVGEQHWLTAMALNGVAQTHHKQGRDEQAEPMLERALAMRKQVLGEQHPDVATILNNLAALRQTQEKYAEAETLYEQALAIYRQASDDYSPAMVKCLNNLAGIYSIREKHAEALSLLQQALQMAEQLLGNQHPVTILSIINLAYFYKKKERYEDAESFYKRALAMSEQIFGAQHIQTKEILNGLAGLYQAEKQYGEAESLYKRALAISEQIFGARHLKTAQDFDSLAKLYWEQERYKETETLLLQVLAIRELATKEQTIGISHSGIVVSLMEVGLLYFIQGRYREAEALLVRALTTSEQVPGALHLDTAQSLKHLASLYREQRKYGEAEPLFIRALTINKQLLGEQHSSVATALSDLAELYQRLKRYAEAEPLYTQALVINKQALGEHHRQTAQSLGNLAGLYRDQSREEEAESLYIQALEINRQVLGKQHSSVATTLSDLAGLYREQKRYIEAERLYIQAIAILETLLRIRRPDTLHIVASYVSLLEHLGKQSEATSMRNRFGMTMYLTLEDALSRLPLSFVDAFNHHDEHLMQQLMGTLETEERLIAAMVLYALREQQAYGKVEFLTLREVLKLLPKAFRAALHQGNQQGMQQIMETLPPTERTIAQAVLKVLKLSPEEKDKL